MVIADKAYDNNDLLAQVEDVKGVGVIPSKSNRKVQRCLDRNLQGHVTLWSVSSAGSRSIGA